MDKDLYGIMFEEVNGMSPNEKYDNERHAKTVIESARVVLLVKQMKNASIYDGKRLAQPDEVANFKTGDGLEKAFLLANIFGQRNPEQDIEIIADKKQVILKLIV